LLLTIILPTFNDLKRPLTLKVLDSLMGLDVIVVDTPSDDGMESECKKRNFTYLKSTALNRASRLNEGIKAAKGPWLVFHHPRSILSPGFKEELLSLDKPSWGAFTHRFDKHHPLLNFTSFWSNRIRGDLSKIYYLDHCLFTHQDLLNGIDIPFGTDDIFEDTIFCERLQKVAKPVRLQSTSMTSSIRFKQNGLYKQAMMNQFLKIGYKIKMDRKLMNKIYEKGLNLNQRYKS